MTRKRMLLLASAAIVLGLAAFGVMAVKDRTYAGSSPYAPQGEPNSNIAVVYYSRSGHSEAVAREVARFFNAPVARIEADYARDFAGQGKAISDANSRALPPIRVERSPTPIGTPTPSTDMNTDPTPSPRHELERTGTRIDGCIGVSRWIARNAAS